MSSQDARDFDQKQCYLNCYRSEEKDCTEGEEEEIETGCTRQIAFRLRLIKNIIIKVRLRHEYRRAG